MRRRKNRLFTILFILILFLGLGYALLSQDLTINGITKVKGNTWSIYFDNVQVSSGSVELSNEDSAAEIDSNDDTLINYTVTLNLPGDFYEFTVDVVNDGSVDGMIGSIISKYGGTVISSTNPLPSYIDYTVTYIDDIPIAVNHLLEAGDTETYKVRVEFKREIENNELPETDQSLSFSFGVTYVQADNSAQTVLHPESFTTDSWETIINAVQLGITDVYHVGDTKSIELGNSLGTHTLRIANMSTPSECGGNDFSQTACGFVLEFVDIIARRIMHRNANIMDGWPATELRVYLNNLNDSTSIINSLPEVLRNAIIDTVVITGYGLSEEETNYISTDKLFLLSPRELWEDIDGDTSIGIDSYDTAYHNTRQLDYYAGLGVTMGGFNYDTYHYDGNYSGAIKLRDGSAYSWWLRSNYYNPSSSSTEDQFSFVNPVGGYLSSDSNVVWGVSPAFRIG